MHACSLPQVLVLTSQQRIMGQAFVNTPLRQAVGWVGAAVVMVVNVVLIYQATHGHQWTVWTGVPALAGITAYLAFVGYLVIGPSRSVLALENSRQRAACFAAVATSLLPSLHALPLPLLVIFRDSPGPVCMRNLAVTATGRPHQHGLLAMRALLSRA